MQPLGTYLVFLALFVAIAPNICANELKTEYSTVSLIAEQESLPASGGTITVALDLVPDPGWHAYWLNPGDAGKEASIRWTLAKGFEAAPLEFPTPTVIPFGDFVTYGFKEPILLLADITVPALAAGTDVELVGRASWVVCDDALCVPEQADLALTLPVGDGRIDADTAPRFVAARGKLPQAVNWPTRFALTEGSVEVDVASPRLDGVEEPYLYVAEKRLVRYGEQTSLATGHGLRFAMAAHGRADETQATQAVLTYRDQGGETTSVYLALTRTTTPFAAVQAVAAESVPNAKPGGSATLGGVLQAVLFGLIGGVVLNLMPCVFPILSMKALGLVQLSGQDQRRVRESGLLYTAGILVMFLVIATLLIVLRQTGEAVGWGFQLQSPWVNVGLGLVMVAIGLNLAGVFEIGTRLMGLGQSLATDGSERRTAFLTGLLAVVVATPCTAPFMAGALGFALAQPAAVALTVFVALGLGLALPYLVLSFVPALGRALPKPGPWMATFRHVLAFPMLATALWLFWVIGQQLGATSMAVAHLAALLLSFALWAYGRSSAGNATGWRIVAVVGLLACVAALVRMQDVRMAPPTASTAATAGVLGTMPVRTFTPERLLSNIQAQRPTFVYFTADWCISCKVNERVALATDTVGNAINERGIAVLKADWTTEDPTITEWLAKYDRAGVPLYLYFPRGATPETATVLPQVLLPGTVVDAINNADAAANAANRA